MPICRGYIVPGTCPWLPLHWIAHQYYNLTRWSCSSYALLCFLVLVYLPHFIISLCMLLSSPLIITKSCILYIQFTLSRSINIFILLFVVNIHFIYIIIYVNLVSLSILYFICSTLVVSRFYNLNFSIL